MRHTILPLTLLLLGVAGHAGAQTPPVKPPVKAPAPLTLAQALTHLLPPAKGVLLAVGADKVTLPDGTLPPPADASVTVLANTFGDETQDFGSVTAIAPAAHVLLNTNPASPDSSGDVDQDTAFHLFAASLNDVQWKAFTSEGGLGLTDLTDDTQKSLFHALFPHGQLWVASQDLAQAKLPDSQRMDTRNLSDQIDSVRVRLGQSADIYISDKKGRTIYFSGPPVALANLHTWQPKNDAVTENNVIVQAVVSNTSKSSGLLLSDAKFQPPVSLTGMKTVADLVARIAAKTQTELYADPHYASRALTFIGPTPEAPAADVLRALALAVAGTYRQVGPAYVLTDDLEGVGTRRRRLFNLLHGAFYKSRILVNTASDTLIKNRAGKSPSLSAFGDPLAVIPSQASLLSDNYEFDQYRVPYAKLNAAQQNRVHQIAAAYEAKQAGEATQSSDEPPQEPDLTQEVRMFPNYTLQLLLPGVNKPVETDIRGAASNLFLHLNEVNNSRDIEEEKAALARLPPAPPLPPLLHSRARRAVIGHPKTPAAVDALVAAMQKVGLNELWLNVFSEGKSHIAAKGTDILTEALKQTQGTGIAVYADLSLLSWGYTPPKDTWDLDILGQNSHFLIGYDAEGLFYPAVPPPVSASPVSDTVKKTLIDTVRGLASRSGLAGFIWEDAVQGKGLGYPLAEDLGYTSAMRLAFLRAFHADPVDITDSWHSDDLSLPTFDDSTAETALTKQWSEARLGASALLLTELRQAIPASAHKPIFMDRVYFYPHALTTWDDPHQMPPALPSSPGSVAAAKRGREALVRVTVTDATDIDALARSLQTLLPDPARDKAEWDGYVLDFDNSHVTDGTDPLRDLVRAVGP